mgnify:CR=1 FL=1
MKVLTIESNVTDSAADVGQNKTSLIGRLIPTICWSAVLAGVAIAVSVQLVVMMLGVASGVALANLSMGEATSYGALLWASGSIIISAFIGAYVAGHMSGLRRKMDGVLHGIICWAVSVLLALILATTTSGSLISGLVSNVIQGGVVVAPSGANVASMLNRQLGPTIESSSLRSLQEYVLSGRRDQAIDYLTGTMNVQRERAASIVDQALIISGASEQASPEGRAAAARATKDFRTVSWTTFIAVMISVVVSCLGGALGALGIQRVIWSESSEAAEPTPNVSQPVIKNS